jgi:hypothetical protein
MPFVLTFPLETICPCYAGPASPPIGKLPVLSWHNRDDFSHGVILGREDRRLFIGDSRSSVRTSADRGVACDLTVLNRACRYGAFFSDRHRLQHVRVDSLRFPFVGFGLHRLRKNALRRLAGAACTTMNAHAPSDAVGLP